MHPKKLKITDYTYELPAERIAQQPLAQRDASKILVYQGGSITEDIYSCLSNHLPDNALLVFNQTKVIHARLLFQKPTGSTVEIFCLEPVAPHKEVSAAMLAKNTTLWKCMVGGAAKWKDGQLLSKTIGENTLTVSMEERYADTFLIEFRWDDTLSFADILQLAGDVPLPPYMRRKATLEDEDRYQTIFAKEEGSVAAPTAALHFTQQLVASFQAKNILTEQVTLHVGAGTFLPVKSTTIEGHTMHAEWIDLPLSTIKSIYRNLHRPIVAVGTTSLRTLESLYWLGSKCFNEIPISLDTISIKQWEVYESLKETPSAEVALQSLIQWMETQQLDRLITQTQILIAPGYEFKIIKGLITNFHQPQSTLLLLVAALIGGDWKVVYQYALDNNFRFLSYGDGCLLWGQ